MILLAVAWGRSGEYDEYYSVFLIAGDPRPPWPFVPFTVAAARGFYHGHASPWAIAAALRRGDVHPPLYFWMLAAWRDLVGMGLFRLRLLSVLLSLAALTVLARIARRIGASPVWAIIATVLCYGFAYTGVVARNFALADFLVLAGTALLIEAEMRPSPARALAGGFALGAACFSNYLASFTTILMLAWFIAATWRQPGQWLAAVLGAASFIPAGLWFFIAQAETRHGQFRPFDLTNTLAALARDQAGAILGALPRYAPHAARLAIEVPLAVLLAGLAVLAIRHGKSIAPNYRTLVLAGILAPPLGLLALGIIFDNTPIEVRYFWLGLPYIGLAMATLSPRLLALPVAVQAAAIIGLAAAPQTMQPGSRMAAAAARAAGTGGLAIVPFGNDGVGVPGPFAAAAPPALHVLVARQAKTAPALASAYPRIAIAEIAVDASSRALAPELAAAFLADPCWRPMPAPTGIAVFVNRCVRR